MLDAEVKQRINHERMLREKGLSPRSARSSRDRQFDKRVRDSARKGIGDLTFLVMNLPERHIQQIFDKDTMRPLIKELLSVKKRLNKDGQTQDDSDDQELRRKRVLQLWNEIFQFRAVDYVIELVGNETWRMLTLGKDSDLAMRAIYYAAVFGG